MEDLTYRRLLDWYYLHESPIPLDELEVARQIRMRSHSDCIAVVLREYFERTDDGWIHHRANKELAKAGEKSTKASQSAKARWDKKSNKNKDLPVDANALRTQSEGNATHNTLHITQDTEHKKKATVVATPEGVSESVWQDFVKHRKAKKAQVTQTVIDGIVKQALIAGWTLEDALRETIIRNWASFKADWVQDKNLSQTGQMNQRVSSGLTRGLIGGNGNVKLLGN